MKTVATPGYLAEAAEKGGPGLQAIAILARGLQTSGQPSWVIGDPTVEKLVAEDEGRTLKIKSPFRFYAIRDDHEKGCDCGCGGQSIVTLLLPEEY